MTSPYPALQGLQELFWVSHGVEWRAASWLALWRTVASSVCFGPQRVREMVEQGSGHVVMRFSERFGIVRVSSMRVLLGTTARLPKESQYPAMDYRSSRMSRVLGRPGASMPLAALILGSRLHVRPCVQVVDEELKHDVSTRKALEPP